MKRPILYALACSLLACTTDPGALDPTGTWAVSIAYGAGDCGVTGSMPLERTITGTAPSLQVGGYPPGNELSGSVLCDEQICIFSFTEIERAEGLVGRFQAVWNLDTDGAILGQGTLFVTFPDSTSCYQDWTAAGTLR
jgi:hypothetical protein